MRAIEIKSASSTSTWAVEIHGTYCQENILCKTVEFMFKSTAVSLIEEDRLVGKYIPRKAIVAAFLCTLTWE